MNPTKGRRWNEPYKSRLLACYAHQKGVWLVESDIWGGVDLRYRPRTRERWQFVLFAAASGGAPEPVRLALQHRAPSAQPINYAWRGVEDGRVRTYHRQEPAYYSLRERGRRQRPGAGADRIEAVVHECRGALAGRAEAIASDGGFAGPAAMGRAGFRAVAVQEPGAGPEDSEIVGPLIFLPRDG